MIRAFTWCVNICANPLCVKKWSKWTFCANFISPLCAKCICNNFQSWLYTSIVDVEFITLIASFTYVSLFLISFAIWVKLNAHSWFIKYCSKGTFDTQSIFPLCAKWILIWFDFLLNALIWLQYVTRVTGCANIQSFVEIFAWVINLDASSLPKDKSLRTFNAIVVWVKLIAVWIYQFWCLSHAFSLIYYIAWKASQTETIHYIKRIASGINLCTFTQLIEKVTIRTFYANIILELIAIWIKIDIICQSRQTSTFKQSKSWITRGTVSIYFIVGFAVGINWLTNVVLIHIKSGWAGFTYTSLSVRTAARITDNNTTAHC